MSGHTELFFVALSAVVASFSEIWRKVLIWSLRLKHFYLTSPCLLWPRDFLYQDCHAWCKPFIKIILTPSSIYPSKRRPLHSNFFTILAIIHEQEQQNPPFSNCHNHLPPSILVLTINQSPAASRRDINQNQSWGKICSNFEKIPGELWWFWSR